MKSQNHNFKTLDKDLGLVNHQTLYRITQLSRSRCCANMLKVDKTHVLVLEIGRCAEHALMAAQARRVTGSPQTLNPKVCFAEWGLQQNGLGLTILYMKKQ